VVKRSQSQYRLEATSIALEKQRLTPLAIIQKEDQRTEPLYYLINNIEFEINVKSNTSQQLFNESDKPKKESDPQKVTPKKFHQFLKVFDKTESEKLPPR
jgi:hypothetical protein